MMKIPIHKNGSYVMLNRKCPVCNYLTLIVTNLGPDSYEDIISYDLYDIHCETCGVTSGRQYACDLGVAFLEACSVAIDVQEEERCQQQKWLKLVAEHEEQKEKKFLEYLDRLSYKEFFDKMKGIFNDIKI